MGAFFKLWKFGFHKAVLLIEGKAILDLDNPKGRLISTRKVEKNVFDF